MYLEDLSGLVSDQEYRIVLFTHSGNQITIGFLWSYRWAQSRVLQEASLKSLNFYCICLTDIMLWWILADCQFFLEKEPVA